SLVTLDPDNLSVLLGGDARVIRRSEGLSLSFRIDEFFPDAALRVIPLLRSLRLTGRTFGEHDQRIGVPEITGCGGGRRCRERPDHFLSVFTQDPDDVSGVIDVR